MSTFKRKIIANLKNARLGKRVDQHIVVFDSDDWGSQRMPSKKAFDELVRLGILNDKAVVNNKYDTIARSEDLNTLFDLLSSFKGADGKSAKLTPFGNPVNPDFVRIKDNGFTQYYYETFLDILDREGEKDKVQQLWLQAIQEGIVSPQFHGREHLSYPMWMDCLQDEHGIVRTAFEHHFYAAPTAPIPQHADHFLAAMFFMNDKQKEMIGTALEDGINIMNRIFGTKPTVFAPPNGVSHPYFDEILAKNGVMALHNPRRWEPDGQGGATQAYIKQQYNTYQQLYYSRNCVFEPVAVSYDAVDFCMTQVQAAFNWHKVAIISTHRVNYVGGIDPRNRERGIRELKRLLKAITTKWPDVIFMTTDEYVNLIRK